MDATAGAEHLHLLILHLLTLFRRYLGNALYECQRWRSRQRLKIGGVVVEPRQARLGVHFGRRWFRWRGLPGEPPPLCGVGQRHKAAAPDRLVPRIKPVWVSINLLLHATAGSKAHVVVFRRREIYPPDTASLTDV